MPTFGRTSTLIHGPTGNMVKTPLLVPSFSSKGFRIPKQGAAEVETVLQLTGQSITEAYLLSAYDIYHKHLPAAEALPFRPTMIILDSGGYEVSDDKDLSDVREASRGGKPWDIEKWHSVVSGWPQEYATILVNYDHPDRREPLDHQIEGALDAFRDYRHHLWTFLLKPETKEAATVHTVLNKLSSEDMAKELRPFDVIGVTEKELGSNLLERMVRIARLRGSLDRAHVKAPIHVFGSLDPLGASLYFLAGAEIFDGLTWIRYSYKGGLCVYIDNAAAVDPDHFTLSLHHDIVRARTMWQNLSALEVLKETLIQFHQQQDFVKLGIHGEVLRKAADALIARIGPGGI